MDPLAAPALHRAVRSFELDDTTTLAYELYTPHADGAPQYGKVLVIWGAFATSRHFEDVAEFLKSKGFDTMLFDHRGVGRSGPCRPEAQSASLLASDALALVDHVWGPHTPIHVIGASMGGMVGQELAYMLATRGRLMSAMLVVSARGLVPPTSPLRLIAHTPLLLPLVTWWYGSDKEAIVERLLRKTMDPAHLASQHPTGNMTYAQAYRSTWLSRFDELFTFSDPVTTAAHTAVLLTHWFTDAKAQLLRSCGAPILVQVHERDELVPPRRQRELAALLHARIVTFPTGHMGMLPWRDRFLETLAQHLGAGEVLHRVRRHGAVAACGGDGDGGEGVGSGEGPRGSGAPPAPAAPEAVE